MHTLRNELSVPPAGKSVQLYSSYKYKVNADRASPSAERKQTNNLCLAGNSVPALELPIPAGPLEESVQFQRSRSQSLDGKSSEAQGASRKRCHNPSVTQPLSPSHSSPQKSLSELSSFLWTVWTLCLSLCLCWSVRREGGRGERNGGREGKGREGIREVE